MFLEPGQGDLGRIQEGLRGDRITTSSFQPRDQRKLTRNCGAILSHMARPWCGDLRICAILTRAVCSGGRRITPVERDLTQLGRITLAGKRRADDPAGDQFHHRVVAVV